METFKAAVKGYGISGDGRPSEPVGWEGKRGMDWDSGIVGLVWVCFNFG